MKKILILSCMFSFLANSMPKGKLSSKVIENIAKRLYDQQNAPSYDPLTGTSINICKKCKYHCEVCNFCNYNVDHLWSKKHQENESSNLVEVSKKLEKYKK